MADANVSQLEINGTTYDICDATARDSLSQYVLKSGDTVTGNLTIQSFDTGTYDQAEGGYLFLKNNYIDSRMGSTQPSESQYFNGIMVTDINNDIIRYDETAKTTTGALYRSICLRRCDINGENPIVNGLYLHINDDGTKEIDVTDPAAWRKALTHETASASYKFFRGDGELTNVLVNMPFETMHTDYDLKLANNSTSTTRWPAAARLLDKNGLAASYFGSTIYSDGNLATSIYAYNYDTSGNSVGNNYINLFINKNGTKAYAVADPAAFRRAIQVDSFWTVAKISVTVGKAPNSNTSITAPTVSGYSFWSWYYFATNGWVGTVYCSGILVANTSVWVVGNSAGATSGTGTVDCYALYKRN